MTNIRTIDFYNNKATVEVETVRYKFDDSQDYLCVDNDILYLYKAIDDMLNTLVSIDEIDYLINALQYIKETHKNS